MRASRIIVTGSVSLLALGFLGQSPSSPEGNHRHISSCGDATQGPTAPSSSFPAFPSGLFSYVQDDAVRQAAEAYSLFVRQLQLNIAVNGVNPFGAPSIFGFPQPAFPSYALPSIDNYQVNLAKPDTSHLMWAGLSSDPALQYLVRPMAPKTSPVTVAAGGLDGLIDLAPLPSAPSTSFISRATIIGATSPKTPATALPAGPDLSAGGRFETSKF